MSDAVVVIPVLERPDRVEGILWSIENGRGDRPYGVLFVASQRDQAEVQTLRRLRAPFIVANWNPGVGDWAKKVNLAYRQTREPWLLLGADDLCWCPGWLDRALECADATGAGVVGTDDLGSPRVQRGQHSCHPLVRRSYVAEHGTIDERDKVCHEGYDHNFVDDELVETAKSRGQWAFCGDSHVEHLHPHWGKGKADATYAKGQAHFADDRRLFRRRSALWG